MASWRSLGPFGGSAQAIVQDPKEAGRLLAATQNGLLYRSQDGGTQWAPLTFAPALSVSVHLMAVAPSNPPAYFLGIVPASSTQAGLYRSTDAGESWQPLNGLAGESVYSFAFWKRDPRVVLAGCQDGIFLSRDGGDSWKRISPTQNLELQTVTSLAIDPMNSDVIYAGTAHLPWKTIDGGKNWQSIHSGMIDDSDVFSIEVDQFSTNQVFASACSGIYRTNNGGSSWTKLLGIPHASRRTYTIRQDPMHANLIYAGTNQGFWKSGDGGTSWRRISGLTVKSIAFDNQISGRMYLASDDAGLLVSSDGGETTRPMNQGFVNRNLTTLAAGPRELYTTNLYSRSERGVRRMSTSGTWTAADSTLASAFGNVLSVVPTTNGFLLARTYDSLVASLDDGKTWSQLQVPWKDGRAQALQILPGRAPRILAGTSQGLYRSDRQGSQWIPVPEVRSPVEGIFVGPADAPEHMAVVATSTDFRLSTDDGASWQMISPPTKIAEFYDLTISSDGILLAGTARGAFRSVNRGQSWEAVSGGPSTGTVPVVLFHPARPIGFAVCHGIVYRSADGGANWLPLDMQGIEGASIRSLAVSPAAPASLFALARARGVFVFEFPTTE